MRTIKIFKWRIITYFLIFPVFLLPYQEHENVVNFQKFPKSNILTVVFAFSWYSPLGKKVACQQCGVHITIKTMDKQYATSVDLQFELEYLMKTNAIPKHSLPSPGRCSKLLVSTCSPGVVYKTLQPPTTSGKALLANTNCQHRRVGTCGCGGSWWCGNGLFISYMFHRFMACHLLVSH